MPVGPLIRPMRPADVSDVERLTGRRPTSLAEYLAGGAGR